MAAGKISELVDDSAIAQLESLYQKLGITTQAMVAGTDAAAGYIAAISKVNTIAEFNAANQQTVTVMGEVKQAQQNVISVQKEATTATNQVVEAMKAKIIAEVDSSSAIIKLSADTSANARLLVEQKLQLAQVTTALKENAKTMGDNSTSQIKNIETTAKLTQQEFLLKEAISQNISIIKQQTKEQLASETSNNAIIAQYNQLIKLQNTMSAEMRIGTENGRLLQEQIDKVRASMVAAKEAQGDYTANVGNYPGRTGGRVTDFDVERANVSKENIELTDEEAKAIDIKRNALVNEQAAIIGATQSEKELANSTIVSGKATKEQIGLLASAQAELKLLNKQKLSIVDGEELSKINSKIQQTEVTVAQLSNVGKLGFDEMGNKVEKTNKGLDVSGRLAGVLTSRIFRMAASFLLITVALGAITWLYDWIKNLDVFTGRLDQATQNLKALNEVQKNAGNEAGQILGKYRILSDTIKDLSIAYEDRLRAATELKKLFPVELEHSTAQAIANGTEADSLDRLADSVVKLAKAKAASAEIEKQEGEIIQLQIQRDKVNAAKAAQTERQKKSPFYGVTVVGGSGGESGQPSANGQVATEIERIKREADKANTDIKKQIDIKNQTIKMLEQYGGLKNEAESIEGKGTLKPAKDKTNDDDIANAKAHLELVKATAKETLDSENSSYEQRLTALKIFVDASNRLIDNERVAKNKKPGITAKEKDTNNTEAKTQGLGVSEFDASERLKIQRQAAREFRELMKALDTDVTDDLKESLNQQEIAIEADAAKKISILTDEYAGKKITEQNYNREVKLINDRANEAKIQAEIDTYKQILAVQEAFQVASALTGLSIGTASPKDIQGTKNKIATSQIALSKAQTTTKTDQGKDDNKDQKEKTKEVLDFSQQAVNALTTVEDLINQNAQAKIDALQKQSDLINRNAQAEKDGIDNSILSSKEKARQQKIVDAQTRQSQLEIANQERKIKRDAAKFDKAANIAKVIEGTAVAIVSALSIPIYGEALAIVIGAIGAAQLAVVASQPLPAFQHGGTVAKDGYIQTGEAGTELRIDPSGAMSLTADKTNVTYAKAGTKIISNKELMNIVGKPEPIYYASNTAVDTRKMEKLLQENNELQKRSKRPIVNINGDRFGSYSQNRNY